MKKGELANTKRYNVNLHETETQRKIILTFVWRWITALSVEAYKATAQIARKTALTANELNLMNWLH